MLFSCFRFFPFSLGVREGFEYLVVVGGTVGRVAQYGLVGFVGSPSEKGVLC